MKKSLVCNDCGQVYRIEPVNPLASVIPSVCPNCGSKVITLQTDKQLDYFELLGETVHLPGYLLRELYSLWNPQTEPNFIDFVYNFIKGAA